MKVVIDTNVLVSGLLSPFQAPGRVLDMVLAGEILPVIDDRIMAEYREVLTQPKFSFEKHLVEDLLAYFDSIGITVSALPWELVLPDPDDKIFLEVAKAADAPIVTGNIRHFPSNLCDGILIFTPKSLIELWEQTK